MYGTNCHFLVRHTIRTFWVRLSCHVGAFHWSMWHHVSIRHVSKNGVDQSEAATCHVGAEQMPDFFDAEQMPDISWCGTNAGHQWPNQKPPRGMLVRNKYRLVRNKCRTLVGVERMPAISWYGTNAGY